MSLTARSGIVWSTLALFVVAEAVAFSADASIPEPLLGLHTFLTSYPLIAPLLFVLIYALAVTLFFPGTLLCLLGGALFGPWLGALLNVAGATLGAALAFLIARHFAAELVERHLSKTLQRVKHGVEREGWRFVALVRLIPMVPYDLSCYAFGLCRLPLTSFVAANALALLPRLSVYAYIGHSGLTLFSGEGNRLLTLISMAMLLVAVLLLPHIYGRMRHPLKP